MPEFFGVRLLENFVRGGVRLIIPDVLTSFFSKQIIHQFVGKLPSIPLPSFDSMARELKQKTGVQVSASVLRETHKQYRDQASMLGSFGDMKDTDKFKVKDFIESPYDEAHKYRYRFVREWEDEITGETWTEAVDVVSDRLMTKEGLLASGQSSLESYKDDYESTDLSEYTLEAAYRR